MKTYVIKTLTLALALTLIHCGGPAVISPVVPPDGPNTGGSVLEPPFKLPVSRVTLEHSRSCTALLDKVKTGLNQKLEEVFSAKAECPEYYGYDYAMPSSDSASDSSMEDSAVSFTDTNLQEANIDEADLVKTDGEHVYVAGNKGIDVFRISKGETLEKLTTIELAPAPNETYYSEKPNLFLNQNRLVVLNNNDGLKISVYNVATPASPVLLYEKQMTGRVASSRIVDDVLHVATNATLAVPVIYLPYPASDSYDLCQKDKAAGARSIQIAYDDAKAKLKAEINELTVASLFKGVENIDDCSNINYEQSDDELYFPGHTSMIGLYSLDLDSRGRDEKATYVTGSAYEVYASAGSIYVAGSDYTGSQTNIHRFAINSSAGLNDYTGSQSVPGYILNQFSMSEYENVFRIATTTWGSSPISNQVYLLDATSEDMPILGGIENIAPGETMQSARFIGDRGYLVTFKRIDPLFVLDLSDPAAPAVQGELKVPGFSTYLHALDQDHLIGLGMSADVMSSSQGVKLSVFDVADGFNPTEVDNLVIGSQGTSSMALSDHHAFTFDPASGILALPIDFYDAGKGGSNWGNFKYSGVHLYQMSSDGIESLAEIALSEKIKGYDGVLRTILINDGSHELLLAIDTTEIYLMDLDQENKVVDKQNLSNDPIVYFEY